MNKTAAAHDVSLEALTTDNLNVGGSFSPLEAAVAVNNIEAVEILLDLGADPNFYPRGGRPAIFSSMSKEAVKLLVEAGANVNYRLPSGHNPLHLAESAETWRALRNYGTDIHQYTLTGLSTIMMSPNVEIFRKLLAEGLDPTTRLTDESTALFYNRDYSVITEMVKLGIDVNTRSSNGNYALHVNYSPEAKRALLDLGASPFSKNAEGKIPIETELFSSITIKIFCENNPKIIEYRNEDGQTPLMSVIKAGSLVRRREIIQEFIQCGSDLGAQDSSGATSLHIAAGGLFPELIEILLDNDANPKIKDNLGRTPFSIARENISFKYDPVLLRLNDIMFQ